MKSFKEKSDPSFLSLRMFDDDSRFEPNTNRASYSCPTTENKLRTTHVTFWSCLEALNSYPTTLIEIAAYHYCIKAMMYTVSILHTFINCVMYRIFSVFEENVPVRLKSDLNSGCVL